MNQWAAGAQDCLEDVVRSRIQDTRQFPVQRAPQESELREELVRWTGELTELLADVGVAAALLANPGVLQPLPEPASAADFPELAATTRTTSRSRSRERRDEGRDTQGAEEGDLHSLLTLPGGEQHAEGDDTVFMEYGGYGDGEGETEEDDNGPPVVEEEADTGTGNNEVNGGPFPAGNPPGLLGPLGAEELDTDLGRMGDMMSEEVEFGDRAMLVHQAVRGAMHDLDPGSAREVIRRMMFRQDYLVNLQFWLHRALAQALRTCPPSDGPVSWPAAREAEEGVWRRIMGLEDQDPVIRELRAAVEARLRRREEHLRAVEETLSRERPGRPGPYTAPPLPSVSPAVRLGPNTRRGRDGGWPGSSTDAGPQCLSEAENLVEEHPVAEATVETPTMVTTEMATNENGDFVFEDSDSQTEDEEGETGEAVPPGEAPLGEGREEFGDSGGSLVAESGAGSASLPVRPSMAPHLRPWRPRATRDARRRVLEELLRRRVLPAPSPEDEEDFGGGIGTLDIHRRRTSDGVDRRREGQAAEGDTLG